jgi:glycyl-tRNA synthetase beta chain
MKKGLLIEIGTEEIPAGFLKPALDAFAEKIKLFLSERNIAFGDIKTYGTPRRMALLVKDVDEKQPDFEEEVIGPPKKVAIDNDGNFTKAAYGFAASQNVDVKELKIITKDKKEYIAIKRKKLGENTIDLLKNALPEIILSIPFPKNMRWGEGNIKFVRPIHWILALFGKEIIPFNIGDVQTSNYTIGHRFMANNKITIESLENYEKKLEENLVIIDIEKRKHIILTKAREIAKSINGVLDEDMELIETVANLCEYPIPLLGYFDSKFLALPKEILITTMKKHQKYLPIFNTEGQLLPNFIIVSNTQPKDTKKVVEGNSKVIRARFSDAEYYFEKDKKILLQDRVEKLKKVIFQERLGTYYEKTKRLIKLCDFISSLIAPSIKEKTKRAAYLCKADLVTGMVYEFPALQGIIGGELAKLQKEDEEIAKAIYEHYLPQSPEDPIPSTLTGRILSLADKIDSLTGFFGIGIVPKGASDPYGLRRMAIGIIRIITETDINCDYTQFIRFAYDNIKNKVSKSYEEVLSIITDFIENRLYYQMQLAGFRADIIDSIVSTHPVNLANAKKIIEIMNKESQSPLFNDLMLGFKRVANITKGLDKSDFDINLFKEEAEKKLYNIYVEAIQRLKEITEKRSFSDIPVLLANLKLTIDEYFEKVLVMDKDQKIRENRLSFLVALRKLFSNIMDFTKIQQ